MAMLSLFVVGERLLPSSTPKLSTERGLLECDYGSWTGRELKKLTEEPLWRVVQVHPSAAVFPDGEGLAALQEQLADAHQVPDAGRADRELVAGELDVVDAGLEQVGRDLLALLLDLVERHHDGGAAHRGRAAAVGAHAERNPTGVAVHDLDVVHRDAERVGHQPGRERPAPTRTAPWARRSR